MLYVNNMQCYAMFFYVFIGTSLHYDDWSVSKSTLERVWSSNFSDVKIPATNRFSKCQTCERLKKMIFSGNIEQGHELSQEELVKLGNDKVWSSLTFWSFLHCMFELSFIDLVYVHAC